MNHNTPRQGTSRVRPSREEIQDHANYFRQVTREETTRAHHARSDALGSSAAQSVARSTRLATIPKILVQLFKGKGKNKEEKQEQFGRAPPGIFHPSTSTMDSPAPPRQQPLPVLREQSPAFSFTSRESIAAAEEMRETESRDSLPRSVSPVRRLSLDSIDLQLPIKHFETILPWYQTAYPTGIVLKFNEHSAHSARAEQLPLETVQWGVLKPGEKMLIDGRVHSLYSLHRDYNNQGVIINGIDVAKLTRNRLIVTTKHRFKVPDVEYDSLGVVDFDILESSGTLTLHIRRPGSYATEKAFVEVTDSERMSLLSECLADEKKKHLASRRGAPELLTLWRIAITLSRTAYSHYYSIIVLDDVVKQPSWENAM
ncbi:hypothetical protein BZA05DRAFT_442804 [Tricharina praecox]|uniref:uncharacterized protein n=1 Tax=Tricharina praecox TaxID=43433 RepID=UPI00221F8F2A|nr:uncharacterized protein BZA05DRAFT_442804 [Tricharina praecox]KAI5855145.1 hypothetical protein BZA05DRAFT_442804 [Tricharina praecox]